MGKTRWPFHVFYNGCQPISSLWRCWWHLNIFCPVLLTRCGILLGGLLSSTLTKVDIFNKIPSFPVSSSKHWMPFLQKAETSHSTWVALVLSLGLWFACGACPFITMCIPSMHFVISLITLSNHVWVQSILWRTSGWLGSCILVSMFRFFCTPLATYF